MPAGDEPPALFLENSAPITRSRTTSSSPHAIAHAVAAPILVVDGALACASRSFQRGLTAGHPAVNRACEGSTPSAGADGTSPASPERDRNKTPLELERPSTRLVRGGIRFDSGRGLRAGDDAPVVQRSGSPAFNRRMPGSSPAGSTKGCELVE